jgi:hypothetical protein
MTEAEFTPAWVSNVLDTEVKSFQTHLCGQLGCRAHALLCMCRGDHARAGLVHGGEKGLGSSGGLRAAPTRLCLHA